MAGYINPMEALATGAESMGRFIESVQEPQALKTLSDLANDPEYQGKPVSVIEQQAGNQMLKSGNVKMGLSLLQQSTLSQDREMRSAENKALADERNLDNTRSVIQSIKGLPKDMQADAMIKAIDDAAPNVPAAQRGLMDQLKMRVRSNPNDVDAIINTMDKALTTRRAAMAEQQFAFKAGQSAMKEAETLAKWKADKGIPLNSAEQRLLGVGGDAAVSSPVDWMTRRIDKESGGNAAAKNPNSTASGLGQITQGTFNQLKSKHPELANTTFEQYRNNKNLQLEAAKLLTTDNDNSITAAGFPLTDANRDMYWKFGADDAPKILNAPEDTKIENLVAPRVINANPELKGKTAGEVIAAETKGSKKEEEGFVVKPKLSSAETARSQRAINALGGIKSALETINQFEIGTNVGPLPNLTTKDGMTTAVRNYVGRKVSPTSADQLNTMFSGIGRNLAAIETSGLATGLSDLSKQLQSSMYINPGKDDAYAVAMKLADMRRIAVENIKPAIESGQLTTAQTKTAEKLIKQIEEIVPFTTTDVVNATREAKGKDKATIGEATKGAVAGGANLSKDDTNLINRYLNQPQ